MNWAAFIWFALLIMFLVVEANTVTMVSSWFAAGALVAMIASFLHAPIWLQTILFLAVSAALLALLRPFLRKFVTPNITKTNINSGVGSIGSVTTAIDNLAATGQVKLGAMEWSARSTSGEPIAVGTTIRVDRIEGVKAFVSVVSVPAESK